MCAKHWCLRCRGRRPRMAAESAPQPNACLQRAACMLPLQCACASVSLPTAARGGFRRSRRRAARGSCACSVCHAELNPRIPKFLCGVLNDHRCMHVFILYRAAAAADGLPPSPLCLPRGRGIGRFSCPCIREGLHLCQDWRRGRYFGTDSPTTGYRLGRTDQVTSKHRDFATLIVGIFGIQGMGRHTMEEVRVRVAKDLDACVALLESSGDLLTGATPCQADCFLFALIHLVCARPHYDAPCADQTCSGSLRRCEPQPLVLCRSCIVCMCSVAPWQRAGGYTGGNVDAIVYEPYPYPCHPARAWIHELISRQNTCMLEC